MAPIEGGLNPLLQDIGLIIHPPMLYMGYVGFAIPFAFAIAALIGGQFDSAWARWSRPWINLAWVFLTIGITLGSWWAYYESVGVAGGFGIQSKMPHYCQVSRNGINAQCIRQ